MTTIKLHNTRTRTKEDFVPIDPDNVRMYVCGPTVYDRAHLGNARPVVVFDVLYRLLRHVYGPEHVTYVRNFTDVDDKINATALARKQAGAEGTLEQLVQERSDETIGWYLHDMGALGALEPDQMPRATRYIDQMIAMIEDLIAKGHAYEAEGHVLFAVDSWRDEYGKLSGRSVDDMIAGARVEVAPYKKNPMDFVLWKPSDDELPGWESPWGRGRPGWHIECSAMSYELLGESFDIHGGGNDLMFPHHENEIAQSKCAHPHGEFARYWLHNEMLQVEGKKMSKSLGNFFTVHDLLDQGVPGEVIRFVFLQTHYRKPMDWTEKKAREAEKTLRKIARYLSEPMLSKPWTGKAQVNPPQEFLDALANDLNTSLALSLINKYLKNKLEAELVSALNLLGFDPEALVKRFASFRMDTFANEYASGATVETRGEALPDSDLQILREFGLRLQSAREHAMKTKNFSELDQLKSDLLEAGAEVRMSKEGIELLPGPDFDRAKLEALK
ncbi:cysteine--tRNA ligase [Ruegeria arenilitoris]|uniref:cysteine--tRNA ligase n=1 Tax=Ruegeria arenilitoris TaxID=1173585 RepID=UPI001480D5E4|nr:cysteine--tRNA ligase [Ruegeria arenilitoris]